jgi:hypothetical protein
MCGTPEGLVDRNPMISRVPPGLPGSWREITQVLDVKAMSMFAEKV